MGILINLVKDIFVGQTPAKARVERLGEPALGVRKVLNVGGASKSIPIPEYFAGWQHDLLDIDPRGGVDIVCDARELSALDADQYDALYCSHNLEHYYRHDGLKVIKGFVHILKKNGFAEVRVPDIEQVIKAMQEQQLDLDDVLYQSAAGPITSHDVLYGLQSEIASSGQDFYAHKTGFTIKSLPKLLVDGGFHTVFLRADYLEIHALAFKAEPTADQIAMLKNTWALEGLAEQQNSGE